MSRRRGTAEKVTETVNRALDEQGCSYCRKYKPADQVRKVRAKITGRTLYICDCCRLDRANRLAGGGK